jgi:hypothetical protein
LSDGGDKSHALHGLRLGKIPNNGKPEDHAEAGQMGWSRVDWVRVYGE